MNLFVESVTNWVMNPSSWFAPGPVAQFIGILLVGFAFLQSLPNDWAGGKLFSRKAAWLTYILTAVYVMVVFVAPFVGYGVVLALVVIFALLFIAFRVRESWKTQ